MENYEITQIIRNNNPISNIFLNHQTKDKIFNTYKKQVIFSLSVPALLALYQTSCLSKNLTLMRRVEFAKLFTLGLSIIYINLARNDLISKFRYVDTIYGYPNPCEVQFNINSALYESEKSINEKN